MYATDLAEDELLTRVEIPRQGPETASGYVKKPSPSSGYALVGVAATLQASAEFRAHLLEVYTERALHRASDVARS